MSFLEDLRKQQVAEAEARRIVEKKRLADDELVRKQNLASVTRRAEIERQRPSDRREYWQRAKNHFEQSGVRGMLNELVKMKAARSISEDKDNRREGWEPKYVEFKTEFHVKLDIKNSFGSSSRDGDLSINIMTDVDGEIIFFGKENQYLNIDITIRVPRAEWENNKGILEEALGKAYRHPIEYRTPPRNEPSGDGRNGR